MSTTAVSAGQIMDRVASLLNDSKKTDYTYDVILPYLNMAIEELSELMEETNNSPSNETFFTLVVPVAMNAIGPQEDLTPGIPKYPDTLVEVQEVSERDAGSFNTFTLMKRVEFPQAYPPSRSLGWWYWEDQRIRFNINGATTAREILLKYVSQGVPYVANADVMITMINSRSYLAYKTAAFCAMFIGENESRAGILNDQADKAIERITNISNKGRQQIATRHRPFRASYKTRGGF